MNEIYGNTLLIVNKGKLMEVDAEIYAENEINLVKYCGPQHFTDPHAIFGSTD